MGEAVLAHTAKERGIDIHVESAGTAGYHVGAEPDERSVRIIISELFPWSTFIRKDHCCLQKGAASFANRAAGD